MSEVTGSGGAQQAAQTRAPQPDASQQQVEGRAQRQAQAENNRDSLVKDVYEKLFSWLVRKVNAVLDQGSERSSFNIGLLDIFGFEIFEVNSFEQLCINYANERLQQQFNWDVFKSEQAEYESEGIEWQYIEFVDNQALIDLIAKKPTGVLPLLDEQNHKGAAASDGPSARAAARHHGGEPSGAAQRKPTR